MTGKLSPVALDGEVDYSLRKLLTLPIGMVRGLFDYDPLTGVLTWRVSYPRVRAGSVAGSINKNGCRYVMIGKKKYKASRVIWAHYYGEWPNVFVDHENLDPDDNRLTNLRLATRSQNNTNKPAMDRVKGVSYRPESGRWRARATVGGEIHNLGTFDSEQEAHGAYCAAANVLHGDFARTE